MKKITRFFIVIALAGLFSACSNTDVLEPESENQMEVSVHAEGLRSVEQALDDLHFMLRHMGEEQKIHRRIKKLRVLNKSDIRPITRAEKDTPLAYVVNFENEDGYAILGADKKIAPVIMIGDHGVFPLENYKKHLINTENKQCENEDIEQFVFDWITKTLNTSIPVQENLTRSSSDTSVLEYSAPLLKTKWGQSWPYNYCNESPYEDYPVGCGPVALAQFLTAVAFERNLIHPSIANYNIDWEKILLTAEISPRLDEIYITDGSLAVANLLRACRKLLVTKFNMISDKKQATTSTSNFFRAMEVLGYEDVTNEALSTYLDFVRNSIYITRLPVLILGETNTITHRMHICLADGWLKVSKSEIITDYIHINFGYGGNYDGYYTAEYSGAKYPNFPENDDSDLTKYLYYINIIKYSKIGGFPPFRYPQL